MRWISSLLMLALLTTVPAGMASEAPNATDAPEKVHLSIVAKEEGCTRGATFCYEVTEGNLSSIQPGRTLTVDFENHGEAKHELMVRTLAGTQIAPAMEGNNHGSEDGHADDGTEAEHGNETPDEHHGEASNETADDHGSDERTTDDSNETAHANETADEHHDESANETADDHDDSEEGDQTTEHDGSEGHSETGENATADDHDAAPSESHGAGSGGHADHLVPPGGSRTVTFTVPEDAEGVYLWCSVPGHEEAGMADEVSFHTQSSDEETLEASSLSITPVLLAATALGVAPVAIQHRD